MNRLILVLRAILLFLPCILGARAVYRSGEVLEINRDAIVNCRTITRGNDQVIILVAINSVFRNSKDAVIKAQVGILGNMRLT